MPNGDKYSKWKSKLPKNLQWEGDYNLRGLYESDPTVKPTENLHFPDTYKLPNHPSFSTESQGWLNTPWLAGQWSLQGNGVTGQDVYTPFNSDYKEQIIEPHQFKNGGMMKNKKKAAWGMNMGNFNGGFSPSVAQGFDRGYNQMYPMQDVPLANSQSLPVHPVDQLNPAPIGVPNETQVNQKKPWGFTTPGTGSLIAGAVGIANALMPDQNNTNMAKKAKYGGYNPYSQGIANSQAIYEDGGAMLSPRNGYRTVQRKEGNIMITEEVPINFPMGNSQQSNSIPAPYPAPQDKKSIAYEKLRQGNYQFYSPVFNGPWTNQERKTAFSNGTIPKKYGNYDVSRGDMYDSMWNHDNTPANNNYVPAYNPGINITTNMGANAPKPYNPYQFKNGGNLSVGQELDLSDEEIAAYEKMGYKFKK